MLFTTSCVNSDCDIGPPCVVAVDVLGAEKVDVRAADDADAAAAVKAAVVKRLNEVCLFEFVENALSLLLTKISLNSSLNSSSFVL